MENISSELTDKIFKRGFNAGKEHSTPSAETLELFENMQNQDKLIIGMIKELKNDNKTEHKDIKDRLDITNGNIARIKTKQLYLRGILIGAGVVLFILGLLPERMFQIVKLAF